MQNLTPSLLAPQDHTVSFKRGLHAIIPAGLLSRMASFVSPKEFCVMIAGLQVLPSPLRC